MPNREGMETWDHNMFKIIFYWRGEYCLSDTSAHQK
jgi:hypothetical protein